MGRFYLLMIGVAAMVGAMLGDNPTPQAAASVAKGEPRLETARPAEADPVPEGAVAIDRDPNGHFYADIRVNGAAVRAMVDTGASTIALTREDARRAGIATAIGMPGVVAQGAAGEIRGEFVTIERVALGHRSAEALPAVVLDGGEQTLLGQNFLAKFEAVTIEGDRMILR